MKSFFERWPKPRLDNRSAEQAEKFVGTIFGLADEAVAWLQIATARPDNARQKWSLRHTLSSCSCVLLPVSQRLRRFRSEYVLVRSRP